MKRVFARPGLAILLTLAWLAVAQAQGTAPSKAGGDLAADPARLRAMAEQGDRDAQFRLGELYEDGEIVERDLGKALEAYREAAEQGHPGAQYALAHIYHLGSGVEQDMAAAMVWYRKAALQGDERSQLALGDQYRIGLAVPRDLAESAKWYRMAADQGNGFAQYELGNAYRYGHGVRKSLAQAVQWYWRSAEAGNPSAELALADLEIGDTETGGSETGDVVAGRGIPTAPEPDAPEDTGSGIAALDLAAGPTFSETGTAAAAEEKAAVPAVEINAEPPASDDEMVPEMLALAGAQSARLALTTPAGDNAYETYQRVLSVQPDNQAALDGIERIGVKYVELARRAAAKGDFLESRRYAAKANNLAPDHPLVRSMAIPTEEAPQPTKAKRPTSEVVTAVTAPAQEGRDEGTAEVAAASATPLPVTPTDLVQDTDDLIFRPHSYRGRDLVVTGSVVRLFGLYRLKSESGQNSIVIDIDGLGRADRANLRSAVERAGFLGQVEARITGRVERQTPVTFELAARELVLTEAGASTAETLSDNGEPDFVEESPPVALLDPGSPAVESPAIETPASGGQRGSNGAPEPEGKPETAGLDDSGGANGGGWNGRVSSGQNGSAPAAAPVNHQPAPAYVPTCYRDTVWRRLADGRIQTGTRTRCY